MCRYLAFLKKLNNNSYLRNDEKSPFEKSAHCLKQFKNERNTWQSHLKIEHN